MNFQSIWYACEILQNIILNKNHVSDLKESVQII